MKDKISGMGEASNVAHLMMQTHHDIVLDSLARNASLQQHEMAQFAEFAEFADISKELVWFLSFMRSLKCMQIVYHIFTQLY